MKSREMRQMTNDALLDYYEDAKASLYRFRLLEQSGELVDTTQFKKTRHELARVLTILRERELAAELVEGSES